MKAIVYTKYGTPGELHLQEIEKPVPGDRQLLIRVRAASVNAYDWRHVRADPWIIRLMGGGFIKPGHPVLGADMAGVVEAVGRHVKQFKPGDEVFGEGGYGGFAEYACVDPDRFVLKPSGLPFEDAAATPMAALTALQGLRDKGQIQAGQKVLINGASGGVGTFAIQIAQSFGAEVTGVCSTAKMDLVRAVGADHVIDYTTEDILLQGPQYDLIFDIAVYRPFKDNKRLLKPGGKYVVAGGSVPRIFKLMFRQMMGAEQIRVLTAQPNQPDLVYIRELLETERIKPVIDQYFPLHQTAEAVRHVEEGRARGKVVVRV